MPVSSVGRRRARENIKRGSGFEKGFEIIKSVVYVPVFPLGNYGHTGARACVRFVFVPS